MGIISKIKLYADNVPPDDCHQLQADLEQWAKKWNMIFTPSKCDFLNVTNKANLIHMSYHIQNEKIKEVPHVKHLGVTKTNT